MRYRGFSFQSFGFIQSAGYPKFILIDEADFFRESEQEDVRHVSERYIGKSDPFIVLVSTPNAPNGLFEKIERESEDVCIYNRLTMDYTYGIAKIYSKAEIEKAMKSPSFEREYNLKYPWNYRKRIPYERHRKLNLRI